MRAALWAVALAACGRNPAAPAVEIPAVPDAPPTAAAPAPARVSGPHARLRLSLRSTPPGAAVTVDGRVAGPTPTAWEVDDDGRAHDFTFMLDGYETWRLRFAPSHDGVIHAPLRARPEADAGARGSMP
jgi:hypothetical protein